MYPIAQVGCLGVCVDSAGFARVGCIVDVQVVENDNFAAYQHRDKGLDGKGVEAIIIGVAIGYCVGSKSLFHKSAFLLVVL
ncbi:hypothetical protein AFCDBAGC_3489 [Methylobacterium cerastii]|uniref:Uncharacterized protein n=1 Tax=Methylobacterium cerastii TaxID=932741 RepID=A0ABQ4QK34_9HYPH|nr:hypothetical protein AFCDBAGC_3489 [Methylobacterium cerastii]